MTKLVLRAMLEELYEKKSAGGEDYQELQEARGVGGVGVCDAGD